MKALRYFGPRDIRYDHFDDPVLQDDRDAVMKVHRCALCGSDLHIYHGQGFSEDMGYCVGHEAVGEIVEIGRAVKRLKVGVNQAKRVEFPMGRAFAMGLTFRIGTCSVPQHWPELVPLIQSGRLRPERFISHHLPLAEGARAYQMFDAREEGSLKFVLEA